MGRLIDEKTAIQRFVKETEDSGKNIVHINTIKRILQDVETAYNVEKVVADIRKQFGCKDCEYADVFPTPAVCSWECAELEVINDICDIVKRGGIDERT